MWHRVCKEAAYTVWSSVSFMTPAWTFLKRHDALLSSLIGSTSHHLRPLSSFFFFLIDQTWLPAPSTKPLTHVFLVWKPAIKREKRAQIEFQGAEEDSLGYHSWMICILRSAEGGVLVTRGGWWSFTAQRSLDRDLTTFFSHKRHL